jgi:hypothetical protein
MRILVHAYHFVFAPFFYLEVNEQFHVGAGSILDSESALHEKSCENKFSD